MANEIMVANNTEIVAASDFAIPRGYVCTVDITTIEGKKAVMNAINGGVSLADYETDTFNVVDIITTAGVRSRTGEACTNTYLILDNGTTLFTQSDGVKRSVDTIVALFSGPNGVDFGDGITLKTVSQKLPNGNTLRTLVMP